MKVNNKLEIEQEQISQGDIILISEGYFLVCPYPKHEGKFYLPSLDGCGYFGDEPRTLGEYYEILTNANYDFEIFSSKDWEMDLVKPH